MKDFALLVDILRTKRGASSKSEEAFINRVLDPIEGMKKDGYGNRYLVIPYDGLHPDIMFSCHTDTVSHLRDTDTTKIYIDENTNTIYTDGTDCLGADDGAGIYLMIQMIKERIPGLYVFHREEEVGAGGSDFFAEEYEHIDQIQIAVAFDRKGTTDVITHQSFGRCCSDEFAKALAEQLSGCMAYKWKPCEGVFTDTANYTHIIPECTNISVGYYHQHTPKEYLDLNFLEALENALLNDIEWDKLPVTRDPKVFENDYPGIWGYGRAGSVKTKGYTSFEDLLAYVEKHPDIVAEYLFDNQIELDEIDAYKEYFYGT